MKNLDKVLLLAALSLAPGLVLASTADDPATCAISCTVDGLMEWAGNFTDIAIAEHITEQDDQVEGTGTATLYTNGDVTLSADNTTDPNNAQLTDGTDFLVTEYKLSTDGDGTNNTGATAAAIAASGSDAWTNYTAFLSTALAVTHVSQDGAAVATLSVRASNDTGNVADSGSYTATQTITASWAGA